MKSPTLETATRLLAAAGLRLDAVPVPSFEVVVDGRGGPFTVPDRLSRLPIRQALARVRLPVHLNWSDPDRTYDLTDRGHPADRGVRTHQACGTRVRFG
ncbi:hypothetical protein [Frankia gtarii]|uniref:hypothetical protein n=1 Tax=Frankia gtarii TaxID=2950102 RepID=UPI0021C07E0F|nr:hypothetical protein [Frankia gtarii]